MNITVYCGSNPGKNPNFSLAATKLGTWIGQQGHALVYGGGMNGLMGIVADAVLEESTLR